MANAQHNDSQNPEELYVAACYADEAATMKRWRPRARGRATWIRKRTCHVTVIVSRLPAEQLELRRRRREAVSANRSRRVEGSRRRADLSGRLSRRRAAQAERAAAAEAEQALEAIEAEAEAELPPGEETPGDETTADETTADEATAQAKQAAADAEQALEAIEAEAEAELSAEDAGAEATTDDSAEGATEKDEES